MIDQGLEQIKERVKEMLPQYLASMGIDVRKQFRCIDPAHDDKHPSAGVIKQNPRLVHCFSCGLVADIFNAATFLEHKPSSGRAWVTGNLMYLAQRFGFVMPELNLSDSDLLRMDTSRAYSDAMQILRHSDLSDPVKDKLKEYGWSKELLFKFGIGSVTSHDAYLQRMAFQYGHKPAFLQKIGLDKKGIFNEQNLIYTIKDADGSPIAFAARDLRYEAKRAAYDQRLKEIEVELKDERARKARLSELFKPVKYINSSTDNGIYEKGKVLFNFDQARKSRTPLVVFEGYADCVTAFSGGVRGAVALGSTSFTREHLDLVLAAGIKHMIFVLDADSAGQKGTERVMKLVQDCSGHVGLRIEVIALPEGSDDPDAFIRKFADHAKGVAEFRRLHRTDMFSWRLKEAIERGEDPLTVCENTIPLIVNESSNLIRLEMADKLAQITGKEKEFVRREVLRLVDQNASRVDEELNLIANDAAAALRKEPRSLQAILAIAQERVEIVEKRSVGYDVANVLKSVDYVFDEQMKNATEMEIQTGNRIFDSLFGGLPRRGALFCLPGKPHHGKSIFLDNLITGILDNNADVMVLLHTVDDSSTQRVPRILGARYGLDSKYFAKAGYYLSDPYGLESAPEGFEETYGQATGWYRKMHEEERLIVADTSDLVGDLTALKAWVKTLRERHPSRTILVMGDNFHLYDLPTEETGEGKIRAMSRYINDMLTSLRITGLFTMEIPKDELAPGRRPKYTNLKGSAGLSFDAKVNIGIYNELQDIGDEAVLYWHNPDHMETVHGADGGESKAPRKMPIIEAIIDKNKVSGEKRTIYFRLDNKSGRMEECPPREQDALKLKMAGNSKKRRPDGEWSKYRRASGW